MRQEVRDQITNFSKETSIFLCTRKKKPFMRFLKSDRFVVDNVLKTLIDIWHYLGPINELMKAYYYILKIVLFKDSHALPTTLSLPSHKHPTAKYKWKWVTRDKTYNNLSKVIGSTTYSMIEEAFVNTWLDSLKEILTQSLPATPPCCPPC